jgi:hypothetical protein
MTNTEQGNVVEGTNRIIKSVRDAEEYALEAVRKFVDTVDSVFPDTSEDGPRRKIIDSAFKMTQELVGTSTQLAEKIVSATNDTLVTRKGPTRSS